MRSRNKIGQFVILKAISMIAVDWLLITRISVWCFVWMSLLECERIYIGSILCNNKIKTYYWLLFVLSFYRLKMTDSWSISNVCQNSTKEKSNSLLKCQRKRTNLMELDHSSHETSSMIIEMPFYTQITQYSTLQSIVVIHPHTCLLTFALAPNSSGLKYVKFKNLRYWAPSTSQITCYYFRTFTNIVCHSKAITQLIPLSAQFRVMQKNVFFFRQCHCWCAWH